MAKILLCDDSKTILRIIEKNLTSAGHQVVGKAADGAEGVSLFTLTKPDLLLLDVTMPNKDGRECLEEVLKTFPTAKVIMISALSDEAVVQECIKLGAKMFISKTHLTNSEDFKKNVLPQIESVLKAA